MKTKTLTKLIILFGFIISFSCTNRQSSANQPCMVVNVYDVKNDEVFEQTANNTEEIIIYRGLVLIEAYSKFLNDKPAIGKHLLTVISDTTYISIVDNEHVKIIYIIDYESDGLVIKLHYLNAPKQGNVTIINFEYGSNNTRVRINRKSEDFCEKISETVIQRDDIEFIEERVPFTLEIGGVWKGMYYYFGRITGRPERFILSETFQQFVKSDSPIFRFMGDNSIYHRGPIVGLDELRSVDGGKRWLFIIARESNIDDEILTDTISFQGTYSFSNNHTQEERASHVNFIRYLGIGRFDVHTNNFTVERMYGIDVNGKLTETFNPNITFEPPSEYNEEV